MLLCEGDMSDR